MTQQDPSRLSGWLMFEMHCIAWNRNPKFPRNNHKKHRCHTCGYKSQLIKFYTIFLNRKFVTIITCHKAHGPGHCVHVMLCRRAPWLMTNLRDNLFPTELWVSEESQYQSAHGAHSCSLHSAPRLLSERGARCNVRGRRDSLECGRESWDSGAQVSMWGEITPPGIEKLMPDNQKTLYRSTQGPFVVMLGCRGKG